MAVSKSFQSKEDIAMELFKITIDRLPQDNLTKEKIVETYNYIHDNIRDPSDYVQIIDNIPRSES